MLTAWEIEPEESRSSIANNVSIQARDFEQVRDREGGDLNRQNSWQVPNAIATIPEVIFPENTHSPISPVQGSANVRSPIQVDSISHNNSTPQRGQQPQNGLNTILQATQNTNSSNPTINPPSSANRTSPQPQPLDLIRPSQVPAHPPVEEMQDNLDNESANAHRRSDSLSPQLSMREEYCESDQESSKGQKFSPPIPVPQMGRFVHSFERMGQIIAAPHLEQLHGMSSISMNQCRPEVI